jgi:hypothetical protein
MIIIFIVVLARMSIESEKKKLDVIKNDLAEIRKTLFEAEVMVLKVKETIIDPPL